MSVGEEKQLARTGALLVVCVFLNFIVWWSKLDHREQFFHFVSSRHVKLGADCLKTLPFSLNTSHLTSTSYSALEEVKLQSYTREKKSC